MRVEARIIADSLSPDGVRLVTVEGTMHRFVLAELNKHRMLSNSAQSSRAVPVPKMIEMIRNNPAIPLYWGKNQPGMRADVENDELINRLIPNSKKGLTSEEAWMIAAGRAADIAEEFHNSNYHKQIVNRLLEPFMWQKIVISGTEWANFFRLRLHKDAQPEIRVFAECIKDAMDVSKPMIIDYGKAHLPYVTIQDSDFYTDSGENIGSDVEIAKKFSAARCATTSYRTNGVSCEKALGIYKQLVESEPEHSVPLEHVARPLVFKNNHPTGIDSLTTHFDREFREWSGNFRGWGQLRKEIEGPYL